VKRPTTWTMAAVLTLVTSTAVVAALATPTAFAGTHGHHQSDGQIVFMRGYADSFNLDYLVNPDGSNEHLLFDEPAQKAVWAPDGKHLNVRHADGLAATIVDPVSGHARELQIPDPDFTCGPETTEEQCAQTDFSCYPWSPDEKRLACQASSGVNPARNGLYTVRTSDGQGLRLVALCPPACDATIGDWSPDGNRLLFTGTDPDGFLRIYTIGLDGRHLRALTPAGMDLNDEHGGRWSPQGNRILFPARPAPGHRYALWSVSSDGSDLHQLPLPDCGGALDDPASVGCPWGDWSPDASAVVYTHVTVDGMNNWVADLHTGSASQISPDGTNDLFPDWGASPHKH
jgi:hypothetical protein